MSGEGTSQEGHSSYGSVQDKLDHCKKSMTQQVNIARGASGIGLISSILMLTLPLEKKLAPGTAAIIWIFTILLVLTIVARCADLYESLAIDAESLQSVKNKIGAKAFKSVKERSVVELVTRPTITDSTRSSASTRNSSARNSSASTSASDAEEYNDDSDHAGPEA